MKLFQLSKRYWQLIILLAVVLTFFYKTVFLSQLPFPGDLLVGNYEPYKSFSYFGIAPGGVPNKGQGPDVIKEIIPWKKFVIDTIKSGQIPFWNPYNFSGNPLMANFQSGVFYPGNLLFLVLNFKSAWSIYIILAPLLSALFTYLFLKRLKLSSYASIFGGLVFAFSSYMTVWVEYGNIGHTFLWLPLILYFTDRLIEKVTLKNFLGIVISSFVAILAGYIQGVFYIYLVSLVYFLFKSISIKKIHIFNLKSLIVNLAPFVLGLALPIGLAAFQLLPTLELFGASSRGNYTVEQIQHMLNPLYYLITVIVPDFFGNPATRNYWFDGTYIERVSYFGLIPLVLAVTAILTQFKKVEVRVFAFLFLGSLLISTDLFVTRYFYLLPIPVLSTTVATRILSIFAFSGSILGAFGLDHFLAEKNKKVLYIVVAVGLCILGGLFIFTFLNSNLQLKISQRNLIIPISTLLTFFIFLTLSNKKKIKTAIIIGVLLISFADLFYYFQKITPFAPQEFLYPNTPVTSFLRKQQGIDRSWGYGLGYIESNFQTYEQNYSTEGNDPLHVKEYTQLVASSATGRVPDVLPRPDANIAGGFGKEELAQNPYRQKILDITGVKFVLNNDTSLVGDFSPDNVTFPEDRYKLVWQEKPWQVYENLKVTPRAFLTNQYKVKSLSKTIRTMLDPTFNQQKEIVLNEDPKISKGELKSDVRLTRYDSNFVSLNVNTNISSLLFLSDTLYPGWMAYVDEKQTKIFRADYAFRAIVIPAGSHKVTFEYQPQSFYHGIYISIATVILLVGCSLFIKRKYEI